MKIYCAVWYDHHDNDLSPCYGDGNILCFDFSPGWDELPLFITREEAEKYVAHLERVDPKFPPNTYRVYEIDCDDPTWK